MFADTKPELWAISWPTLTLSPFATKIVAGAPICCDTRMLTFDGKGSASMGLLAEILFSGG